MTTLNEAFNAIVARLKPKPKRKRLDLVFVPMFPDGERLCNEGWEVAREDDMNKVPGWVYLELLEDAKV